MSENFEIEINGKNLIVEKIENQFYFAKPYYEEIDLQDIMNNKELKQKLNCQRIICEYSLQEDSNNSIGYYIKII